MVVNVLTVNMNDNKADQQLLLAAQHHQRGWRVKTQIASLGRDHNSESELLFLPNAYWFVWFFFFFASLLSFLDLSSPSRYRTHAPCSRTVES